MSDIPDKKRRAFVSTAAKTTAAAVLAPGVFFHSITADAATPAPKYGPTYDLPDHPRTSPVTDKVRWGMVIDTSKCVEGCNDCVTACSDTHGINLLQMPVGDTPERWEQQKPQWIHKVTLRNDSTGVVTNLPMMCQHCEFPPCVDVCPTGASFRRADGIVMVDRHTCIGCRYCMMACPYQARSFIHENVTQQLQGTPRGKGCVESCNFCARRLDYGATTTVCQDACTHGAIVFGDLKDPNSAVAQELAKYPSTELRANLNLNTGVRYRNI